MPTLQTVLRPGQVRIRTKKDGSLTSEQDFHCRILADSLTQNRNDILLTTPDTPKFGVVYGSYNMMLKGCDAQRLDENSLLWDAVYNLSNQIEEGEDKDPSDGTPQIGDPTEWIPVVELGFEDYEEVFYTSLDIGNDELDSGLSYAPGGTETPGEGYNAYRWINSAGQPYDSGFVRQQRIITRAFTQFEPITGTGAVTLDDIESRNDTLNDSEYLGRPKRTLKLSVNGVAAGFYYGLRCWRVDYVIAYKPSDWRLKKLDIGWVYKDENGDTKPFLDKDGNNIQGALDGNGRQAADQQEPFIRAHKEFESVDFSSFLRLA